MYRYLALAWDHRIEERAALAKILVRRLKSTFPEWRCLLTTDGLHVQHATKMSSAFEAYLLAQNAGVILGTIFDRRGDLNPGQTKVAIDAQESRKIRESAGRHLIDHYWGRYVALLQDASSRCVRVIRDPTGAMPCLLMKFREIDVICSHIDDCAVVGLISAVINWKHVTSYLWFDDIVSSDTGLDGVRQIQAGECIVLGAGCTDSTYYWNPYRIYDARIVEDRQQAMQQIRKTIRYCVTTWASRYKTILHELSGGLDSAVVLASLPKASTGARVICQNYFTPTPGGDERNFARAAAKQAGRALIETPLQPADRSLARMLDPTKVATPTLTHLIPQSQLIREEIVKAHDIEAVFSGQGGDHLFQQVKTPLIAAEYAWRRGLRPELLTIIGDTSRFTRMSIWSVTVATLISGILRRYEDPYKQRLKPPPLMSKATRDALDLNSIRHPWIDSVRRVPGNKLQLIYNIVDSQTFYRFPSHYADIVHPLISQPIIELCLQIPSYILTYGGMDRALVRDGFSAVIPQAIVRRRTKGHTGGFFNGILIENLPFIREFLLDGLLMKEGILDKASTETGLTEAKLTRDSRLLFPVLDAIRAETWLRTWIPDGQQKLHD